MLHKRVRRARGKAAAHQCVRCPAQALDWAQIHTEDGTDLWADYVPMCRPCHFRYDYDDHFGPVPMAKWRESFRQAMSHAPSRARNGC